ncbi:MAG: undecaprenyldiphospho-muramoylpentapeptide beta-N-acetylglucosaminyltransferase [Pseudanabaenaceae cyanobacterium SKYGB_i_bin29]|nr:undecaprenyldiphospho-muramoylpentapeptide beta-N-acetylglucosaminyltransferase [Pseudanabaenaceae cyanobacterium SKYG29]MDW8421101.1 undecaprenyldiphospho-muramoylpentapeptide beta-N-acetylglucosaminyltransferase [Pseudanabaenaceae cyanobacterium SKYGB_i_bin29]
MSKRIVLTGGGTAGHVNPNLALVDALRQAGWEISYIGSQGGIEAELVKDLPFYGISSGKLRRYFDWRNFTDPFRVLQGLAQAHKILGQCQPQLVFSKGGFVTVPVVVAAWLRGIPVVIHESDYSPGLANKLSVPFAREVWVTFPETRMYIPRAKVVGLPIRSDLLRGDKHQGLDFCRFDAHKPVLLVMGGSSGAQRINQVIWQGLPQLTDRYQVIHLCGQGNTRPELGDVPHYRQFAYLTAELKDCLAAADLVVSRAGANSLFELLALRKPHLLIPLSTQASRGDQILNAQSFAQAGYSAVLPEEDLSVSSLLLALDRLWQQKDTYIQNMQRNDMQNPIEWIVSRFESIIN